MRSAALFPPTRCRLLPFKEPGRDRACCRNLPFKSGLPFLAAVVAGAGTQLRSRRRPPEEPRPRHGVLDHLPAGGAGFWHFVPCIFFLQSCEDEKCEGIRQVDDVLDCVCLLHHSRDTHRYHSLLEIDEYISQARDKSYETMMRVGKRGLNLAANAAVTAAAKGQGVLSEKLRSFSMQDLTLIRDEDTVHLRSPEPRMRPSTTGLLETVDDSGASCYSSGEEVSASQRHNGSQSDARTDPSDDDTGDKIPKRTQSLKAPKKITKTEPPQKTVKARPKKKAAGSSATGESA
ncbi:receptor expression-enhancing protein 2 isoform X3 [Hemicordylus capensis]|uniref:receptor expression-enhancing protein 2 isoform X3 n=1 Tax=Hemicordylus capensis TaxID=884348 RepID=UPI002303E9C6|nr:receptor expression-enhancing protein 2 isoform X3 [Hemicordylus capensis]